MLQTLLGRAAFRRGLTLYLGRHDGCAATCDDFLRAMADASGADLDQFSLWYSRAGTPRVTPPLPDRARPACLPRPPSV
jgi:aminopeptidase N